MCAASGVNEIKTAKKSGFTVFTWLAGRVTYPFTILVPEVRVGHPQISEGNQNIVADIDYVCRFLAAQIFCNNRD